MDTIHVENHFGLVKHIAERLAARLPTSVSMHELIDAGSSGLVEAAERYRPERGVPFPTYAFVRIQGAMLDLLRGLDWPSRSVRRNVRRLEKASALLEQRLSRPPQEGELAEFLNVSLEDVREGQVHAVSSRLLSLDGLSIHGLEEGEEVPFIPKVQDDIESRVEWDELLAFLCKALGNCCGRNTSC